MVQVRDRSALAARVAPNGGCRENQNPLPRGRGRRRWPPGRRRSRGRVCPATPSSWRTSTAVRSGSDWARATARTAARSSTGSPPPSPTGVMCEAGRGQGVPPDRSGFADALRWLSSPPGTPLPRLIVTPVRPNRIEPRCPERRAKKHPDMIHPREDLRRRIREQALAAERHGIPGEPEWGDGGGVGGGAWDPRATSRMQVPQEQLVTLLKTPLPRLGWNRM